MLREGVVIAMREGVVIAMLNVRAILREGGWAVDLSWPGEGGRVETRRQRWRATWREEAW